VRNCHELGECWPPEEWVVRHLEVGYLKLHLFSTEVFSSPEGHRKSDLADGGCCYSGDYSLERSPMERSADLDSSIWLNVFKNNMFRELSPLTRTQLSLTSLTMGLTIRGYRPSFGIKSGWSLRSKVMGTSYHFGYPGVAGETAKTSWVVM
jgi:hypothetical protein